MKLFHALTEGDFSRCMAGRALPVASLLQILLPEPPPFREWLFWYPQVEQECRARRSVLINPSMRKIVGYK